MEQITTTKKGELAKSALFFYVVNNRRALGALYILDIYMRSDTNKKNRRRRFNDDEKKTIVCQQEKVYI